MILKPDYNVESLFDIDFKEIKSLGINAVLFDLDSTLMPSKSGEFPSKVIELINSLKQNFVLAIISNNKKKDYIAKVQSLIDITVVGNANKPSSKAMNLFLKSVNMKPEETVVIGDRPLTDILAGKILGAKTILVDSITKDTENRLTRFVRKLERIVIKK
ncbi:MAG: YqeG family HAD IIIA-type phosphatase [Candidatus Gastranaerophilales bacterium]|nr:YqeG family HAD IIIA-type phosphatase [Candidatus Gastranaerophilales bacterium]